MRCLRSVKWTNVHASFFFCVREWMYMHARTSIMSVRSLQSNSFRQKSLKQPWFWSSCYPPSVSSLLNSHQPLLLPKITQERHSNPRLTTAQPGRKRRIKTHTKKETHHIVEGGKKSSSRLQDIYWWFWQAKNHTYLCTRPRQGKGKCVCGCAHTIWMKYTVTAKRWHSSLISFSQRFNHKLNKNAYIITL